MDLPSKYVRDYFTEIKATQDDVDNSRTYANFMDLFKKKLTSLHSTNTQRCIQLITVVANYLNYALDKEPPRTRLLIFGWIEDLLSDPTSDELFLSYMQYKQKKSEEKNKPKT